MTWSLDRRDRRRRTWRGLAATVLSALLPGLGQLAAVALPHAALGFTVQRTGEVPDQIRVAQAAGALPQDGQPAPGRPPTDPAPSRTDPARTPTSPAALPQAPANFWQENERLTVAVLGSDAGPGRVGARLDALLVATLDTEVVGAQVTCP